MYRKMLQMLIWLGMRNRRVMAVDFCCIAMAVFILLVLLPESQRRRRFHVDAGGFFRRRTRGALHRQNLHSRMDAREH